MPRFKNWLFVTQYYHPEPGAAQIRLRSIIREMVKSGHNVTVITGMPNYPDGVIQKGYRGKWTMTEVIDGVTVKRLWLYPAGGQGAIKRLLNYFTFTFHALLHLGAARGKDMVFIEAQPITLAYFGLWAKRFFKTPYVYNTPDLQVEIAGERGWVGGGLVKMAKGMESKLMRNSFTVSTVTHAFIDHFIKERSIPRSQMSFLPNGVDLDELHPLPYNEEYAKKMGVSGKKTFTYAGTHADYQGLDVILDAAKIIKGQNDEIVFLMVGKGPERQRLIDRAKNEGIDNVIFKDSPFNETAQLMSIAYCAIVVLRNIPAALKMRLSKTFPPLACGVPVIFGGVGESADIIEKEGCGVKTPPENPGELAKAVLALAADPARREQYSKAGISLAEREFSWRSITLNWLKEIEAMPNKTVK